MPFRRYSGFTLKVSVHIWPPSAAGGCRGLPAERLPPSGGGDAGAHRPGQEGQGHQMVSLPLLTPQTFLYAATPFGRAAKRGLRGLGSGRRFAYRTLLCPEFTLRDLPRITVRGQTVQGGSIPLRKAPLPSRMCPWSTRRPCGPLVFRRATEGSRVQRRVWGVKRGKGTIGALSPLAPAAGRRQCTRHVMANIPLPERAFFASSGAPLYRRKAYLLLTVKKGTAKTPN